MDGTLHVVLRCNGTERLRRDAASSVCVEVYGGELFTENSAVQGCIVNVFNKTSLSLTGTMEMWTGGKTNASRSDRLKQLQTQGA